MLGLADWIGGSNFYDTLLNTVTLLRSDWIFLVAFMFPGMWIGRAEIAILFVFPAFFTSVWLWLYAGSGFLLKAARRFDIGFQWFNRRFDIEKTEREPGALNG